MFAGGDFRRKNKRKHVSFSPRVQLHFTDGSSSTSAWTGTDTLARSMDWYWLTNKCIGAERGMKVFKRWLALSLRCVLVMPAQNVWRKYGLAHISLVLNILSKYLLPRKLYLSRRSCHPRSKFCGDNSLDKSLWNSALNSLNLL